MISESLGRDQLVSILDFFTNGILIYDEEQRLVYANKSAVEFCGLPDSALGMKWDDLQAQGYFGGDAAKKAFRYKSPFPSEFIHATGRHLLCTATPMLDGANHVRYVVSDTRDVTQLKYLMAEIRKKDAEISTIKENMRKMRSDSKAYVYQSEAMSRLMVQAQKIARTDMSVVIGGETGVGKTDLARCIHKMSLRSNSAFVTVNCGSIPPSLCEAEFFGYEKGAFTGAVSGKKGFFETARNGTLFLDEIGELPLFMQAKLLSVLQDNKIMRLGSTKEINVNVRIITASNKDLKNLVAQKKFREDLYHRINGLELIIPPLRDRCEDIVALMDYFIEKYNIKYFTSKIFSDEAKYVFMKYNFPGNVRELSYIIERIIILSSENIITKDCLPIEMMNSENNNNSNNEYIDIMPLKKATEDLEKKILINAKKKLKTMRAIGEALGISHVSVMKKLKYYGIN